MVQYVFTPWRDRAELLVVRQQFYSPANDHDQHNAVARVSMWMQRGNCPHMVESTAILTAAVQSDEAAHTDSAGSATYAARAAYSAAFSRFVTGLLDGHQDKLRKQSMYSLAKAIGLPATFVELRHQATHEQLPSLAKLRTAAKKALAWIWDYYWKHLTEESRPRKDVCRDTVLRYLKEDDEAKRQAIVDEMVAWDADTLLKAVSELQETLPGNQVYLKCLKLSKDIVAGVVKTAAKEEVQEQKSADPTPIGTPGGPETTTNTNATDIGWSRHPGPWKPKPIGMV